MAPVMEGLLHPPPPILEENLMQEFLHKRSSAAVARLFKGFPFGQYFGAVLRGSSPTVREGVALSNIN